MRMIPGTLFLLWLALLPEVVRAQASQGRSPTEQLAYLPNSWEQVNSGLDRDSVFALTVSPEGQLFAGTESGVFRSADAGNTWEAANSGLPELVVGSLAVDPTGILYAATHGGGVFRSFDEGGAWEEANTGLGSLMIGEVEADAAGLVYASAFLGGVFRSLDQGDTWEEVNENGLDDPFVPSLVVNVAGHVFHGTDGGVYRSLDDGDTWEAVNTGLHNLFVEELVVSRDEVLFAGTDGGVYRSMDDGDTWEAVQDANLGERTVRALSTNESFALYAGTHGGGVFLSLNHGASWEPVNEGLANMNIASLVVGLDGSLFAGTVGGGIFRRSAATDVSKESEEELPTQFELYGNYPNPFNPTTQIRYALPVESVVELAVFDLFGRRVATLVNAKQSAGRHEVAFDASELSSGIYFYRLDASTFSEVKQMVLLR